MSYPNTPAPRPAADVAADPQVGDIYEGSWGYDQTNAEFWQVVKRTPKTVTVRRLSVTAVGEGHSTRLVPSTEFYTEPTGWVRNNGELVIENGDLVYDHTPRFIEKVCQLGRKAGYGAAPGGSLTMKSYYSIYPWDGSSAYDTLAAGYQGH